MDAVRRRAYARVPETCLIIVLLVAALGAEAADAAVYDVPSDITADCSVAVDDEIAAWLATVPDGNTAPSRPTAPTGRTGRSSLVAETIW